MLIQTNGINSNVEVTGQDTGEPIILIHGIGADLTLWEDVIPFLEKEFKVIRYDLRGSGKSDFPRSSPLSVEQWAGDLDALMSSLNVEGAHLVGWSLGGMISVELYLRDPKRIKSLTLVGSTPKLQPPAAQLFRERARLAENEGMKILVEKTFQTTLDSFAPSVRVHHPAKIKKFRSMLENHDKNAYAAIARALVNVDHSKRLDEVLCPTLILVGQYDARTPLSDSEMMCMKIPNSFMKIIPDCGHFYPIEQPELFSNIVNRYLGKFSK
jgi:3-oxoadipate enol-lactonase